MENNKSTVFMAYDADGAGNQVTQATLNDDVESLNNISQKINAGNELISRWALLNKGVQYSLGGDQGVFQIPESAIEEIEILRKDYQFATGLTITVGIGKTLSEASKALVQGKANGKNQTVFYSSEVEQKIEEAKEHVAEGSGTFEEQKIVNAYFKPEESPMAESEDKSINSESIGHENCPFCDEGSQQEIPENHCIFCHDSNQIDDQSCPFCQENEKSKHDPNEIGHDPNCQFCEEEARASHNPDEEGHDPNCIFCKESAIALPQEEVDSNGGNDDTILPTEGGDSVANPTTTSSQNYKGQDLPVPAIDKPDAIQAHPDGLGTTFDEPTINNRILEGKQGVDPDNQSLPYSTVLPSSGEGTASVEDVLNQIDSMPGDAQVDPDTVEKPDDADMAVGSNMEGGISRPDGYNSENGDMGLSEDEDGERPDITSVLQEGLDAHADKIKREKVIQVVGEALNEFKQCRDIIDRAQNQAPQLYSASLKMLKAMIEMAQMLGLDQETEQPMENPLENKQQVSQAGPEQAPPSPEGQQNPKFLGQ